MVTVALWLLRYDIARRTIRRSGVTRFIAVCMLSGYGWLGVSGVLGNYFGDVVAGLRYDALLHTLFLGFRVRDDLWPCADHTPSGAVQASDV